MFHILLFKFFEENGSFHSFSFPTFNTDISFEGVSSFLKDRFKDVSADEVNFYNRCEVWCSGCCFIPGNENKPFSLTPSFKIGNFVDLINYEGDFSSDENTTAV